MSETSEIRNTWGESFRVPIDCAVDLRPTDGEWARHSATNISMSGMFIHTAETHPQGTELEVKFELHNGQPAIRGRAEVLWCRAQSAGPDQSHGVGVRFLDLDLESKYAISRLVDRYRQLVRMPFQLGPSDEQPAPVGGPTGRRGALALAFLAGLTAGALGSFWLITAPGPPERESAGVARASELTAETVRREEPASATRPPLLQRGEPEEEVETAVRAWATAWAAKDVERYLGCYAADFRPTSEMTLDVWKAQRRDRLTRPGAVEVSLSEFEIETMDPDRAVARFIQTYSAPGYRDRVRKALELGLRTGEWKIRREVVLAQLPAS